jgi:hypothetical protein
MENLSDDYELLSWLSRTWYSYNIEMQRLAERHYDIKVVNWRGFAKISRSDNPAWIEQFRELWTNYQCRFCDFSGWIMYAEQVQLEIDAKCCNLYNKAHGIDAGLVTAEMLRADRL